MLRWIQMVLGVLLCFSPLACVSHKVKVQGSVDPAYTEKYNFSKKIGGPYYAIRIANRDNVIESDD